MNQRNFEKWILTLKESIADYKYYIDFKRIVEKVNSVRIELNILNSLIGSENIEQQFSEIIEKYPETLKCIPILLAVRASEIHAVDDRGSYLYNFNIQNQSVEQYMYFMSETGLFDMIKNKKITNLVDYVTGVEAGLDSNGRKNRGGHLMENLVEYFLSELDVPYSKEVKFSSIKRISESKNPVIIKLLDSNKRFDFVVETEKTIFLFETNFYATSGSKLNETARSYKMLAQDLRDIEGLVFVWITDGKGWLSTKNNLKETFEVHEHVYNLADIEAGALHKLVK